MGSLHLDLAFKGVFSLPSRQGHGPHSQAALSYACAVLFKGRSYLIRPASKA